MTSMAFIRSAAIVVICAVAIISGPSIGIAQDLSEASLTVGADWRRGYMSLGGHLGQTIAKAARSKATATRQRPRVQKIRKVFPVAKRRDVTPLYLVSMSLDPTGLNVAALRLRARGP
jgi:hypothetical protein